MRSWLLLVPACLASEKTYVQMDVKNYGSVVIELEDTKVPTTVDNFLSYVDDEYYDELVFHRVIKGFMIQGGGYDRQYEKQPTNDPIPLEADRGLDNDKGTIAMARTGDPDSATSQFFINTVDNATILNPVSRTTFPTHTPSADSLLGSADVVIGRLSCYRLLCVLAPQMVLGIRGRTSAACSRPQCGVY